MRLLTYNIQSLRGSRTGVVETIREAEPEVACLQEVPRFGLSAVRCRRLGREARMVAVGDGELAGDTAVLVTDDIVVRRHRHLELSRTPGLHRRGATIATVVDIEGAALTVVNVHLGLDARERQRHVAEVLAALADFDGPFVVAGDINEGPAGAVWQLLTTCVGPAANVSAETFPAARPEHVIDTFFVAAALESSPATVLPSTASDHRPVVVDLQRRP